ncbi:MAG: hypothetical protein KGY55_00555, partial [Candidatus Thermoplasmatota archaeon]|nr:hypothetical protein [Candidatus Thermoplasmatota archaeon]
KFGASPTAPSATEKKLGDVTPGDKRLRFTGKIVTVEQREVEVKGETRSIYKGIIGDETAVLPFTAWKDFGLAKDDVIAVDNAYAGEWGGQPRLNISEWTNVEKTDEDIDLVKRQPQRYDVADLRPGLSNVSVQGKIMSMEEREVTVDDEEKTLYSGILGDRTGKIRYTVWADMGLSEGDVVDVSGAYVKSWQGTPQLVFDENATVEQLDESMPVDQVGSRTMPMYKVVETGGGVDVPVEGVVIEIQRGSGLIMRCPECNRALRDGVCVIDGEVDGTPDLRIKAVVDDGTGAVTAIMNRSVTEKLMDTTMEAFQEMAEEKGGEAVEQAIMDQLIAHPVHVRGNALSDEYGVTVIVDTVEPIEPNIQQQGAELLAELEGDT